MKKVLFLFFILALTAACTSGEDKIRQNAEELIKETMNDPGSYKLVSFRKIGTLTVEDVINNRLSYLEKNKGYNSQHLQMAQTAIDSTQSYLNEYQTRANPDDKVVSMYNDDLNRFNADADRFRERDDWFANYLTNLKNVKGDISHKMDDEVLVSYELVMKGNNSRGTEVTETAYVQADPATNEIINIVYTPEEMLDMYDDNIPEIVGVISLYE